MSTASDTSVPAPIPQGAGYAVLIGFGFVFAVLLIYATRLLKKFNHEDNSRFETFSTAGRKIGTGLTGTAVLSSWLWSTAVLSSTVVTYNYGIAGSFWFGAGCLVQITGFAVLAIQSKLKTPHAHTILEVVKMRYGTIAHVLYTFLCLINNTIAYVNMVLGASATITAITGMNTIAALWLLPIGVVFYTLSGGLKSTFLADYFHTIALLVIVLFLSFKTLTNPAIDSLDGLWRLATAAATRTPVEDNLGGSYLTLTSPSALQFGVLHTLGNFGLVIMDSSYWQKAYSADMAAAVPGYIAAGILYFSVPALLGGVVGLAAVGLSNSNSPIWPAMGRVLSASELNNGLPLAYTAQAVAGKGGSVAVLILIFMAVTSTTSAQLVAVGSIVSSDIYHSYLHKNASEKWIIRMTHFGVILFAVVATVIAVVFHVIGLSLIWTLYFLGIITCPGMVTLCLTVLWKKQTWAAAVVSPIVGIAGGLATWLATASHYSDGVIDVTTTGALLPCLWGTIVSAVVPAFLSPLITYAFPREDFNWERFSDIKLISDDTESEIAEKVDASEAQRAFMRRQSKVAAICSVVLFLAVWIIWPFGMYGARYIFSLPFFRGWIVIMFIWVILTLIFVAFLPPLEGRKVIAHVFLGAIGKIPAVDQSDEKVPEMSARDEEKAAFSATATATPTSPSSSVDEDAAQRLDKVA